jgi:hypothetical protein
MNVFSGSLTKPVKIQNLRIKNKGMQHVFSVKKNIGYIEIDKF